MENMAAGGAPEALSLLVERVSGRVALAMSPGGGFHRATLVSLAKLYEEISGTSSLESFTDEIAQAVVFLSLLGLPLDIATVKGNFNLDNMRDLFFNGQDASVLVGGDLACHVVQNVDTIYEAFMAVHDKDKKRKRGVFYTPGVVVDCITRCIHDILVADFSIARGIKSPDVFLLDPATGSGEFFQSAVLAGDCKCTMAGLDCIIPAAVLARARLSVARKKANVTFGNFFHDSTKEFLKNNLKDDSILVIMGNPPYSVSSSNKNVHIEQLMRDYKKDLKEKNMQPLSDDYIKFLRLAQHLVEQNKRGIVGFVINNSFIYKVIYRVMRTSLLKCFNKIYIINLHGNSNIMEMGPRGDADESVFDIKVGTAIVLLVRSIAGPTSCDVLHHDVFGTREHKLSALATMQLGAVPFTRLVPVPPYHFMVPRDTTHEQEFQSFVSLNEIFAEFIIGVKTHRDAFVVELARQRLKDKLLDAIGPMSDADFKEKYCLKDGIELVKKYRTRMKAEGLADEKIIPYLYRPFDYRFVYYSPSIITRDRARVMRHMVPGNVALITTRLLSTGEFNHCLVTPVPGDIGVLSSRTSESAYFFPLHAIAGGGKTRSEGKTMHPNFLPAFIKFLDATYPGEAIQPITVLGYVYAMLHSRKYRARFSEYLKHDFPRVPFVRDRDGFLRIATLGCTLVNLHLSRLAPNYALAGSSEPRPSIHVRNPRYDPASNRLYVNGTDHVDGVSAEAWAFRIGNYPVLKKWLRGRKNEHLPAAFLDELAYLVRKIQATIDIMNDIDERAARPEGHERYQGRVNHILPFNAVILLIQGTRKYEKENAGKIKIIVSIPEWVAGPPFLFLLLVLGYYFKVDELLDPLDVDELVLHA